MNQLQAIPATPQLSPKKPTAKREEATNQAFSDALKKLVSQKEEQTAAKQEAAKEETAKSEGATGEVAVSPKEPSTDEEIQYKQPCMELLQQLAAGMMLQPTVPTETTAETAEFPVKALLPTEAVEQVQAELSKQASPQPVAPQPTEIPQTGSESLAEMELPKTGALFTVVQTDESGVPVEQQTAKAAKTPVVAEALQAESKSNTPQQAEAVPAEPEKAAVQTTQQPETVQPQIKAETEATKTERPQVEISVTQKTTTESKSIETQPQHPEQQKTPVEGEKVQPQVVERPAEAKEPEKVEKIQVRTEMPAESVQTTQQTQQAVAVRVEPKVVSEPPKTVAVQLTDKLATFEATSGTEFQMQLFPEDLGEVTVKMAVRDGVMVIDILSPNSKTQQILLANADDIKNMLQSQLQQRTQVVIPTEERPADFYHQQQEQSRHQQQEKDSQPEQNRQENIPLTGDFLAAFREIRMAAGLK